MTAPLTDRERQVLEAVIETYVQTAEPAGSRTIAKRYQLGLSPATIRNTMSDLEEKGYLYHPHTSAGRIPTDLAYRVYVDFLMRPPAVAPAQAQRLRGELEGQRAAIEAILSRAAQVLGVLTNELGVAVSPTIEEAVLERLDLLQVSSERLLLVLALQSGAVRTIFVEVPAELAADAVQHVTVVLNERLAGLTLKEIRATLADRLRDAAPDEPGRSSLDEHFRRQHAAVVVRGHHRAVGAGVEHGVELAHLRVRQHAVPAQRIAFATVLSIASRIQATAQTQRLFTLL